MKKLVLAGGLILLGLPAILSSCSKESLTTQPQSNSSTKPTFVALSKATKPPPPKKGTRDFIPLDGGRGADCTDKGTSCYVKKAGDMDALTLAELSSLNTFTDNGNVKGYFSTGNWSLLFPDFVGYNDFITDIINGDVNVYRASNSSGVTFVFTDATLRSEITPANTYSAWEF